MPASARGAGLWLLSCVAVLAVAGAARAQDDDGAGGAFEGWGETGLVLGGKVGGGLGAPFNEFGGSYLLELELGYQLPLGRTLGRSFELAALGSYTAPHTEGESTEADLRLPGDEPFHYEVDQQMAGVGLALRYRIPLAEDVAALCLAAGAKMHFMRTRVEGEAGGERFGLNEETDTALGPLLAISGELRAGPGGVLAELQLSYAGVDAYVLRDTNVAALALLVGYRVMP